MNTSYAGFVLFAMACILSIIVLILLIFIIALDRKVKSLETTNQSLLDLVHTYERRDQLIKERQILVDELAKIKRQQTQKELDLEMY